jgi:hypothetical protein
MLLKNAAIMSLKCSLGDLNTDEVKDFVRKLQSCFSKSSVFSFETAKEKERINLSITRTFFLHRYNTYFSGEIKKAENAWEMTGSFRARKLTVPLFFCFYVAFSISLILLCVFFFLCNDHKLLKPIIGCVFGLVCIFVLHKRLSNIVLNASIDMSQIIKGCIKKNLHNFVLDM